MQQGNPGSPDKKIVPVSVIDDLAADRSDGGRDCRADVGCLISLRFRELKELCW